MPNFAIKNKGNHNSKGVGRIFYAAHGEFAIIGQLSAAPASQTEKVLITTEHTFTLPTDGFRVMYSTPGKTSIEVNGIGEEDSGGVEAIVNCFMPGTHKDVAAFFKDDPDLILLVEHADCSTDEYHQVGSKCRPAKIMQDHGFTTGTSKEGVTGFNFKIHAYQTSALWYSGPVNEPA